MIQTQKNFQNKSFPQAKELQLLLQQACKNHSADALLLSGGIDSALLAALDTKVPAITVVFEEENLDYHYAQQVAHYLSLQWVRLSISKEKALDTIQELMLVTNSYDLSLKGNIPVYIGMQYAKKHNWHRIRTGDGADELFAGYSGVHHKTEEQLTTWRRETIAHIQLPSAVVANALQRQTDYPYLDKRVITFALQLKQKDMIQEFLDAPQGDVSQKDNKELSQVKTWGKVILRMAAKGLLPDDVIWRPKAPLEYGSGFRALEKELTESWKDVYLAKINKENKHFWNTAHACLYLRYKALGLMPPVPQKDEYACTWCGGGIIKGRLHCKTCGAYPANKQPTSMFINTN